MSRPFATKRPEEPRQRLGNPVPDLFAWPNAGEDAARTESGMEPGRSHAERCGVLPSSIRVANLTLPSSMISTWGAVPRMPIVPTGVSTRMLPVVGSLAGDERERAAGQAEQRRVRAAFRLVDEFVDLHPGALGHVERRAVTENDTDGRVRSASAPRHSDKSKCPRSHLRAVRSKAWPATPPRTAVLDGGVTGHGHDLADRLGVDSFGRSRSASLSPGCTRQAAGDETDQASMRRRRA